jgi:GT2 family glycosyltransferase
MGPEEQLDLAEVVRKHREELARVIAEVQDRGEPLTALEARLIVDGASARLEPVERALRRTRGGAMRRVPARLRSWTKPRIGRLRHYPSRPLRVPASYLRAPLPEPAPTISIVTPTFRQARFLERTLFSVLSQGYPSLEYVVQDGGSDDGTREIIEQYDAFLKSWVSESDGGQADAINRGFGATTGEIMAWLNSDDLLLPGALAYVAGYFARHPGVDVVYGDRIMIDANDGQIGAWVLPAHDDHALTLADYVPQETLFWRRSIWEAVGGGVDTRLDFAIDWDLLLRFRSAGARIVHVRRFLGAFRVHEEQKTCAATALGALECSRLRESVLGRPLTVEEVLRELRRYFLRHVLVHTRQRMMDRIPRKRVFVRTIPSDLKAARLSPRIVEPDPALPGDRANGGLPVSRVGDERVVD